jgi:hypothetical protein
MTDRFYPHKQISNVSVARPVSSRVMGWILAIVVGGALLGCGFVMSARQHFAAVSVGYQSEEFRRQSFQLEERLRQLELEYSRASAPVEIERRAKKLGLERPDKKTPVGPADVNSNRKGTR